jgi:3-deoxy-D-manno-octulosonate 8-phosphate phosphatase (KDO 8-P phosphatase)
MRVECVFENISPKSAVLDKILKKYRVNPEELCFVGDDLVDLCLMKRVGFPIAVFNAVPEIKQASSYITLRHGGRGAVREVAEIILKSKGKWEQILKEYGA